MNTIEKIQSVKKNPIKDEDLKEFAHSRKEWIEKQKSLGQDTWLVAYADDGLVWGKIKDGKLLLARDEYEESCPELILETLQHLYLFGTDAEIHIWKGENGYCGCCLEDGPDSSNECIDRDEILWGTKIRNGSSNEFTWVEDGVQGLSHAVPIKVSPSKFDEEKQKRPLRLKVRQYLNYDDNGQVFVEAVRLVDVHEVEK